ncbi:MAG: hypothetical protein M1833_004577 [Piccolia ochrophora]|nr:MAG: hypothetical protein M1833_004577 [Piccolia ochrophora]
MDPSPSPPRGRKRPRSFDRAIPLRDRSPQLHTSGSGLAEKPISNDKKSPPTDNRRHPRRRHSRSISPTHRGRPRRRSSSRMSLSGHISPHPAPSTNKPPTDQQQQHHHHHEPRTHGHHHHHRRRRSHSPSRSHSPGAKESSRRRRYRSHSRARPHDVYRRRSYGYGNAYRVWDDIEQARRDERELRRVEREREGGDERWVGAVGDGNGERKDDGGGGGGRLGGAVPGGGKEDEEVVYKGRGSMKYRGRRW